MTTEAGSVVAVNGSRSDAGYGEGSRFWRPCWWLPMVAVAVIYAPVALTSMWFAFDPLFPRLQERIDSMAGGEGYATGVGSVTTVRTADYVEHRVLMLVHTISGAFALVFGVVLVAARPRMTQRRHRFLGRWFVSAVMASMAAAVGVLVAMEPVAGLGQVAFRWQLWVLAASTAGSVAMAVWSIRSRDVAAHRAWTALSLAFLMTAPALRLFWTALAPFFPQREMLTNLECGAVVLAVVAPAAGVAAAVGREPQAFGRGLAWWRLGLVVTAVGVGGLVVVVVASPDVLQDIGYVWFHVAPVAVFLAWSGCRAWSGASASWALYVGTALAPWSVLACVVLVAPSVGHVEGWLVGLMVAPGLPITAGLWVPGRPWAVLS